MKSIALSAVTIAALSFSACQTLGGSPDALLAGIPADKISPVVEEVAGVDGAADVSSPALLLAASQIRASGANPTCGQFNMNSLSYIANPTGAGMGTGILKTVITGALAGVASGGVSSLGIGNSFLENTVAGTVNQVVFNTAKPAIDSVFPAAESTETMAEIIAAADRIGCPHPTWLGDLSLKDSQKLLKLLTAEFTAADALDVATGG